MGSGGDLVGRSWRVSGLAVCVGACLVLAACGGGGEADTASRVTQGVRGDARAAAWDAEIDKILSGTSVESIRDVLADHVISEAEMTSLQDQFAECLRPIGVTDIEFDSTGAGYETNTPDVAADRLVAAMDSCEEQVGYSQVAVLYHQMLDNPQNEDRTPAVVDCLASKGLIPSTYTVEDYKRDTASDRLPFDMTEDNLTAYSQCTSLL